MMMPSARAKSAGYARCASQDPFVDSNIIIIISTPICIRSAFFLRRMQVVPKIYNYTFSCPRFLPGRCVLQSPSQAESGYRLDSTCKPTHKTNKCYASLLNHEVQILNYFRLNKTVCLKYVMVTCFWWYLAFL